MFPAPTTFLARICQLQFHTPCEPVNGHVVSVWDRGIRQGLFPTRGAFDHMGDVQKSQRSTHIWHLAVLHHDCVIPDNLNGAGYRLGPAIAHSVTSGGCMVTIRS